MGGFFRLLEVMQPLKDRNLILISYKNKTIEINPLYKKLK